MGAGRCSGTKELTLGGSTHSGTKEGWPYLVVIDYCKFNEVTIKDTYPLPLISINHHKLGSSSTYSTLDGTGAYHNLLIWEDDRPLMAFLTPFSTYQFCRMPFGLCNAPQAYSRLVELALRGLDPCHVLTYIDDIIVHHESLLDHLDMLREVLKAHS